MTPAPRRLPSPRTPGAGLGALAGVDALVDVPGYDLRSIHHLGWRDMRRYVPVFGPASPAYALLHRLMGKRVARRKELVESLFVLARLAPELDRARVVCEVGAGHGMVGLLAAALRRGHLRVEQLDRRRPESWERIRELLALDSLAVKTAVRYREVHLGRIAALPPCDLAVGVHLCGALTDTLADLAVAARVPFAVVPCCESHALLPAGHPPVVGDPEPAVTALRLARWRAAGYSVVERRLPAAVTDRSRLFVASPVAPHPAPGRA